MLLLFHCNIIFVELLFLCSTTAVLMYCISCRRVLVNSCGVLKISVAIISYFVFHCNFGVQVLQVEM